MCPLAFYLTPGQTADIKGAVMLADHLPAARYLLADKAYDADHWRALAQESGIETPTAEDLAAETPAHPSGHPQQDQSQTTPSLRKTALSPPHGPWKTRISEPKQKGFARWHGDGAARRAVTNNRTRLLSGVAKEAFKLRAEIVERSFAHNLDRGGMRRTWLRGRENVHKRYLLHVAGHNLSLLMRKLIGAGTPREAVAGGYGCICVLIAPAGAVLVAQMVLIVSEDGETAFVALCFAVE